MSSQATDKVDIEYLKQGHIGKVISKGLAALYIAQPKFPVDYLAKWLLNYSVSMKNEANLEGELKHKDDLKHQHQEQQQLEEQKQQEQLHKVQQDQKVDLDFEEKIRQHLYHDELLVDEFPNFIEQRKQLTGCYIGCLDFSKKEINDHEEDEHAHLNVNDPKLINYIGFSKSHEQLMKNKTLSLEVGVTAEVFKEKEPVQQLEEGQEQPPQPPNYVYIPDLVKEPKMHYFKLPKLGAYMAIPLIYNSCLSEASFDAALDERRRYLTALDEQQKAWDQKVQEYQDKLKELEENGENTEELTLNFENEKQQFEENREKEAQFLTVKREYVVCADTMGQDRKIPDEDRQYLEAFVNLFALSWEEKEKQLLSEDVDRQLQYLKELNAEVSDLVQAYEDQEENAAQEKAPQFEDLKESNEKEYQYELQCAKLDKVKEQISDQQLQQWFLNLKEYRVLKFPVLLQNILYLLGFAREDINKPGTHILNWKHVKTLLNEQFFEKVLEYNHRGPKPGEVKVYALVNRIQQKIEKLEQEKVDAYNLCYGRLLKWLRYTCNLRKQDIEIRRDKIAKRKADREKKIDENNIIKDKFAADLEAKKQSLEPEEAEQFNEEEFQKQFFEDNPLHEIPDEIEDEVDDDCEVD